MELCLVQGQFALIFLPMRKNGCSAHPVSSAMDSGGTTFEVERGRNVKLSTNLNK
jgi:hypothetical protein